MIALAATILETIAAYARRRVEQDRAGESMELLQERCRQAGRAHGERFRQALERPGLSLICEIKKASPSKGVISEEFPYLDIAREYQKAGADAISCLTEPKWFLGSDEIFRDVRAAIDLPMLRKDFTVDPYQIYQARLMGADCVLLICALLDCGMLAAYLQICDDLGLSALVEAHDSAEIETAVSAGAEIIGVNNRNLKDFSVDTDNSLRLRRMIPEDVLFVSESGVKGPEDTGRLREIGADAVLVGEALMRAADKRQALARLRGEG